MHGGNMNLTHWLKRLQRSVQKWEESIEKLSQEKESIETQMGDPEFYQREDRDETMSKHRELEVALIEAEEKWEEAMMELEEMDQ